MDSLNNVTQMELMTDALMMTFSVLHYVGKSVGGVMEQSIQWLTLMYNATKDEKYRVILKAEIMAYMNPVGSLPPAHSP